MLTGVCCPLIRRGGFENGACEGLLGRRFPAARLGVCRVYATACPAFSCGACDCRAGGIAVQLHGVRAIPAGRGGDPDSPCLSLWYDDPHPLYWVQLRLRIDGQILTCDQSQCGHLRNGWCSSVRSQISPRSRACRHLPESGNAVRVELQVGADDWNPLHQRLGYNEPIKRILVFRRIGKRCHARRVGG